MTAVLARRVVMSLVAWSLAFTAVALLLWVGGLTSDDGWVFTVVDIALMFGCNTVATRVWKWSKP